MRTLVGTPPLPPQFVAREYLPLVSGSEPERDDSIETDRVPGTRAFSQHLPSRYTAGASRNR